MPLPYIRKNLSGIESNEFSGEYRLTSEAIALKLLSLELLKTLPNKTYESAEKRFITLNKKPLPVKDTARDRALLSQYVAVRRK